MKRVGLEKYKGLLITLVFFLAFFLVILFLNLYMGNSIKNENNRLLLINSMKNDFSNFYLNNNDNSHEEQSNELLKSLSNKFDVIKSGGLFDSYKLTKLNTTTDKHQIDVLINLINDYSVKKISSTDINQLILKIHKLTNQWKGIIAQKEKRFKILQYVAMVLAIVYFLGIVLHLVRNFETIDSEIESVKDETDNILATVNEGLFLLTPELEIGAQQSGALKDIFGLNEDIEGDFIHFLEKYVPQKSLNIAIDFIGLLFGKRVKENLMDDLNPLKKVQINIERRDGSFETRYIDFNFKRVLENKEIKGVLGSVKNVTKEVLLEEELESTKEQSEAQIDLFMSVLHIPPSQLKIFMIDLEVSINKINTVLKNTDNINYKEKVYNINRIVHKVKGDAAILNLYSFEIKAHEFEEILSELNKIPKLKGENLLPLAMQLKEMISHKEAFKGIFERFDESKNILSTMSESPQNDMEIKVESTNHSTSSLSNLAQRIAKETGKHIALSEFTTIDKIEDKVLLSKVKDCTIQLVRNAIVHGIEEPNIRMLNGKLALGNIYVSCAQNNNLLELIVKDDGAGFNLESIKNTALSKGIVNKKILAKLSDHQIVGLIFRSDFSTKDEVDLHAGRGIGLNLVKTIVDELSAKLMYKWQDGKYTIFKLIFPINQGVDKT